MQATIASSDYSRLATDIHQQPIQVNWQGIIRDLDEHGINPTKQAELIGKERSTLQRWINGSEPHYRHGQALIYLHQMVCGVELTLERFQRGKA